MQCEIQGRQGRRHARRPEVERFPQSPVRSGRHRGTRRRAGCRTLAPLPHPQRRKAAEAKAKKEAAPAAAPAAPAGPAVFPSAVDPKYSKETTGKARMHTCVDQYNANKATNANGGLKWIQKGGGYYSECTKKLKG